MFSFWSVVLFHKTSPTAWAHYQGGLSSIPTDRDCRSEGVLTFIHPLAPQCTHTPPTLCLVAISFPCSLVIFLKCIKSTLLATRIIGKDSLGNKGRAAHEVLLSAPLVKAVQPPLRHSTVHRPPQWPGADVSVLSPTSPGRGRDLEAGCWLSWFEVLGSAWFAW